MDQCWAKAEDGQLRTAEVVCTVRVQFHRGSCELSTSCDCYQAPNNKQPYNTAATETQLTHAFLHACEVFKFPPPLSLCRIYAYYKGPRKKYTK